MQLSELVAPDGYKSGSEVTITVDDEGGISIESEVDGEADFDEDEDGILDYINYPETTITPTATPSAKTTPTGNQTTSRTSVKTDDDTPIALYHSASCSGRMRSRRGSNSKAGKKKKKQIILTKQVTS